MIYNYSIGYNINVESCINFETKKKGCLNNSQRYNIWFVALNSKINGFLAVTICYIQVHSMLQKQTHLKQNITYTIKNDEVKCHTINANL